MDQKIISEKKKRNKHRKSLVMITIRDFKDVLNNDEYRSLSNFLALNIKAVGSKMVTVKADTSRYDTMILCLNTYEEKDVLNKAKERLNHKNNGYDRKKVLSVLIDTLKESA